MAAIGAALFIVTNIGARTGVPVLPFDPHHVWGQVVGAILAIGGVVIAG